LESQLEGFEFARQREPVTDGIDVWGTVFELEHAHHGNIAVVILGTREIYFMASTGSLPGMNTYSLYGIEQTFFQNIDHE